MAKTKPKEIADKKNCIYEMPHECEGQRIGEKDEDSRS